MPKFTASLNLPKYATAPASPVDGDVYYNTAENKVYSRINSAWVDLAAAGGGGSGDITDVVAGAGLTGGASTGSATLTVGAGTGITVNADDVAIDTTVVARKTDNLSAFAATTSAELAGVVSDETGSGALVFATSPTLVTPTIGVATATSINGTTIPSSSTLVTTAGDTITGAVTISNTGSLAVLGATSTANTQVTTKVDGDSSTRWGVRADGFQAWGDGTASRDTNLYRSAANTLKTDDNFEVGQSLTVNGDIIHPAQLDISAGGAVAVSATSTGLYLPAAKIITFEGTTADGFETQLTAGEPTADRTITLPNLTGTLAIGQTVETTSDVTFGDVTLTDRIKHASQLTFSVAATDAASVISTGFYMPPGKTIKFEGTTDNGFETDLTIIDATADNTISLPNQSGTVALVADVSKVYYQTTAPATGNDGDIWIDSDTFTVEASGADGVNAYNVPITTQATARDIALTDLGKMIESTSATAVTITVRSDGVVPGFIAGDQIMILQSGAGQVTIAGNGATINGTPGLKLRTQWSSATLIKRAANTWVLVGDTTP